jgi:hypothetical protein
MIDNREFFKALDKIHLAPVTIRRIFLLLTRLHYSSPENFGPLKEQMKDYLWHKEPGKGKLHIDFDTKYDPKQLDQKPAIFIGLDDIEYKKIVLNNHARFTYDTAGEHLIKTAQTKVIIRHVADSADEAMTLENLTCQFFLGIQPIIRDTLPEVLEYDVIASKSSRPFEKASQQPEQRFVSDTIIALSYVSAWMVTFESHRIKKISFEQCLAECSRPD